MSFLKGLGGAASTAVGSGKYTLLIRIVLILIIAAFSSYFYLDYKAMKKQVVSLTASNIVCSDQLTQVATDKNNLEQYYIGSLQACEATYSVAAEENYKLDKDRAILLKSVSKSDSMQDFLKALGENK